MKKIFTLVAMATMALAANAQNAVYTELGYANLGLNSDATTDVAAGADLGTDAAGNKFSTAFADQCKLVGVTCSKYSIIDVNGVEYSISGGYQGNNNSKDGDGSGTGVTLKTPASGSVLAIECAKDGYMYVVGKFSNNKQYLVYEDGTAIGYTIVIDGTAAGQAATAAVATLKGDDADGYFYTTAPMPKLGDLNGLGSSAANNGAGYIKFACFKDSKYLVCASGSKLTQCGTIFSETGTENITLKGVEDAETGVTPTPVVLEPATTAVKTVSAAEAASKSIIKTNKGIIKNGVKYNFAGQRVK